MENGHYITLVPDSYYKRKNDLSAFFQVPPYVADHLKIFFFFCPKRFVWQCKQTQPWLIWTTLCSRSCYRSGVLLAHPYNRIPTLTVLSMQCCICWPESKVIKLLFVAFSQNGILPVFLRFLFCLTAVSPLAETSKSKIKWIESFWCRRCLLPGAVCRKDYTQVLMLESRVNYFNFFFFFALCEITYFFPCQIIS